MLGCALVACKLAVTRFLTGGGAVTIALPTPCLQYTDSALQHCECRNAPTKLEHYHELQQPHDESTAKFALALGFTFSSFQILDQAKRLFGYDHAPILDSKQTVNAASILFLRFGGLPQHRPKQSLCVARRKSRGTNEYAPFEMTSGTLKCFPSEMLAEGSYFYPMA